MPTDGRYPENAGAILRVCSGWADKSLLLQNLHFRRPWRS